jgi:hypothetical protein
VYGRTGTASLTAPESSITTAQFLRPAIAFYARRDGVTAGRVPIHDGSP